LGRQGLSTHTPHRLTDDRTGVQVRKSIEHVIAVWKRDPSGDRVSRPERQAAPPQPTARASRFSAQPPAGLPGPPGGGPNATHIKVVSYMPSQQQPQAQQASWQQQQQPMQQPGLEAWMQQQAQVQQQYNQQQMQQQQQAPQMATWEQQALQQQPQQQQLWAPAPANGYPPNPPQPLPPPPQQPVPVCLAVTSVLHPQLKDCTCLIMLPLTALVRAALRYSRMAPPLKCLTAGARLL
jgi:flagellar motor protein MotB